jgi:hypothetical protein
MRVEFEEIYSYSKTECIRKTNSSSVLFYLNREMKKQLDYLQR